MTRLLKFILLISIGNWPMTTLALDNGLALTPPLGWLAWERFRCVTDCVADPYNCICERLFIEMADAMVSEGYAAVGYEYIIVDDCWMARSRDDRGRLQADPQRFPNGMKALVDYVHSRGLKFGIYTDYGTNTCGGYPGSLGYLETDSNTFAEWGVDYVKVDGCYAEPTDMDQGYVDFGRFLNATGRPMVYSCSWPVYQLYAWMQPNYTSIAETCNLWRNFDDIQDSWSSVLSIMDYYDRNQEEFIPLAGPGHWNDPDMLIIGNFGLSHEQSVSQMALWAIWASPMLMSNDLRSTRGNYKEILQNDKVIALNQDPLGIQGRRIFKAYGLEIWRREITPVVGSSYSYGIAFLNRRTDGTRSSVTRKLVDLGLTHYGGYRVEDLFSRMDYGIKFPQDSVTAFMNPTGTVLLRFIAQAIAPSLFQST